MLLLAPATLPLPARLILHQHDGVLLAASALLLQAADDSTACCCTPLPCSGSYLSQVARLLACGMAAPACSSCDTLQCCQNLLY